MFSSFRLKSSMFALWRSHRYCSVDQCTAGIGLGILRTVFTKACLSQSLLNPPAGSISHREGCLSRSSLRLIGSVYHQCAGVGSKWLKSQHCWTGIIKTDFYPMGLSSFTKLATWLFLVTKIIILQGLFTFTIKVHVRLEVITVQTEHTFKHRCNTHLLVHVGSNPRRKGK